MNRLEIGRNIKASLEAIKPQSGMLFEEMVGVIAELKEISNLTSVEINTGKLPKLIKKHTGMSVAFEVVESSYLAGVISERIDKNHVLYKQRERFLTPKGENHKAKSLEEIGYVNLNTSKVSGVFTDFEATIYVGKPYFMSKKYSDKKGYFSSEELAAIILHELGHVFTTFEYLGKTVITGLLISCAVRDAMEIPASANRTKVVKSAVDKTDIKLSLDEVQKILDKHGKSSDIVILTESMKTHNGLTKTRKYDSRNFEQLADQFAVNHGAATALSSGLEKLFKLSWDINYVSPYTFAILEVLSVLGTLLLLAGTVALNPLSILALTIKIYNLSGDKIYDDPKDRFIKIKQELISHLREIDKKDKANASIRKKLVEDIEMVDTQINNAKDRQQIVNAIYEVVTFSGRNRAQQEAKQKMLEHAIDNELHAKSAALYNLT